MMRDNIRLYHSLGSPLLGSTVADSNKLLYYHERGRRAKPGRNISTYCGFGALMRFWYTYGAFGVDVVNGSRFFGSTNYSSSLNGDAVTKPLTFTINDTGYENIASDVIGLGCLNNSIVCVQGLIV